MKLRHGAGGDEAVVSHGLSDLNGGVYVAVALLSALSLASCRGGEESKRRTKCGTLARASCSVACGVGRSSAVNGISLTRR